MGKRYGFDLPALREATPTARFGNLIVFRGNFVVPGLLAEDRYWAALSKLYSEKPDISAGEALLRQSAALDPNAFYVNIHLGSVCLRRGSREDAWLLTARRWSTPPKVCFGGRLRSRSAAFLSSL